jgi:REP element-mobilizing transposase RayT
VSVHGTASQSTHGVTATWLKHRTTQAPKKANKKTNQKTVFFSQKFTIPKSGGRSSKSITPYLTVKNHTEVNVKSDPLAFFFTISNYGVWLPGDSRGWIEYRNGWQLPDPIRELEAKARMTETSVILNETSRNLVEAQIAETCDFRNWILQAANCRSNHMHFVISTHKVAPKIIRSTVKAWCTRRLKESIDSLRENWWAERGSIRWVFTEDSLERVILDVLQGQDQ